MAAHITAADEHESAMRILNAFAPHAITLTWLRPTPKFVELLKVEARRQRASASCIRGSMTEGMPPHLRSEYVMKELAQHAEFVADQLQEYACLCEEELARAKSNEWWALKPVLNVIETEHKYLYGDEATGFYAFAVDVLKCLHVLHKGYGNSSYTQSSKREPYTAGYLKDVHIHDAPRKRKKPARKNKKPLMGIDQKYFATHSRPSEPAQGSAGGWPRTGPKNSKRELLDKLS